FAVARLWATRHPPWRHPATRRDRKRTPRRGSSFDSRGLPSELPGPDSSSMRKSVDERDHAVGYPCAIGLPDLPVFLQAAQVVICCTMHEKDDEITDIEPGKGVIKSGR